LKAPNAKELIGCDTIKAAQCENFDFKDTNFSELKNIIKSHNSQNAIIAVASHFCIKKTLILKTFCAFW
ncbi:hypothetical protein, partial [uncultured Campylobacter sp.]|uniref:hypothetical protein n=1 Tax=uncultured Campylobacter sp. TaxID=218934 RepID=UPI0025F89F33